jgi:hypothetical protein
MYEHIEWRVEQYTDEMDPFANIQWYVTQGNIVIAQCEVESHAARIVAEHQRHVVYEQVLQHISAMTADNHDLEAAIAAALRALNHDP